MESHGMNRREALKVLGAGAAALAGLGSLPRSYAQSAAASSSARLGWDLPPLAFAHGALEPHFDARTMEIHHTKHHQAYIINAVKLLEPHPALFARGPEALVRDLASVPESIRNGVRNNAGGHVNHAFFWTLLSPSGGGEPTGALAGAIRDGFGSMEKFQQQFADAAMKRFGSGWAWLSVKDGKLLVHSTANQDSPLMENMTPVIGLDVWEHAYYLHYQNRRADYVKAFWNVLNWTQADANYTAALRG